MRKKICKCGKIVSDIEVCSCRKKERQQKTRRWEKLNPEEAKFLSSAKWKRLRIKIFERDSFHCQRCLLKYGILNTESLEAHHIKSRKNFPELRWEPKNILTLCKTCNVQLGTNDELDFVPNKNLHETVESVHEYKLY